MFQPDVVPSLPKSFPVLPAKNILHHCNYIQIKILKSVTHLTWLPPDGQFSALYHYNDQCHRSVNAVDFKARAQHYNLSIAEKEALTQLSKHRDMIIKPTDKGGAVVVWSHPLYIAEANPQLSNGRFYKHLDHDHDPLKESQHVVKSTIFGMITDNQHPPSAPSQFFSICFTRSIKQATLVDQ